MQAVRRTTLLCVTLMLCAASVGVAKGSKDTSVPAAKPGQAQVVFMRSSSVNMLVGTEIYDATSGQPRVVGRIKNNRKVVLDLAPGDYTFMVGNVPWFDFMQAKVLADKQYFVIIAPHWPTHFAAKPVRHKDGEFLYSSDDFSRLLEKTKLAEPAEPLDEKDAKKVVEFYPVQWEKWQAKTPEQKAELTLRPEDSLK